MPLTLPCDACSFRRVKCDGKNPCSTCVRREQPCTYLKVRKRRGPKGPRRSTNARVQAMQKDLGIEKSFRMRGSSLSASDDSPTSPQPSDSPQPARRRIALSTYYTYIDIFRSQLYTVWPIVSINSLKAKLSDTASTESYALAAALCAATLAQLRLPGHNQPTEPFLVSSGDFERECIRLRAGFDYQSAASLDSLLTSLFLHMYYANVDQIPLATFALRDAITHAHLLSLGSGQMHKDSHPEKRQLRLRVYWILLVTERTFCMQHNLPITLQTIDDLPVPIDDGDADPALLTGFCNLVRLFTRIDGPLIQSPYLPTRHPTYSRARIIDIQEALQTGATKNPIIDEVQRVDIWITLAWLSSLLWQYSASHFMLTPDTSNPFLSPSYPFIIARTFLGLVSNASLDSVRPHGYGMEIKLFQLASSLIDVLVYVPSLAKAYDGTDWGPRHAVVELENLLDAVAGGKSERLDKLHMRMVQMDFTPSPRRALLETESDESSPGSAESEGPSAVDEMFGSEDADSFSDCRTEYHWPGAVLPDDALQMTEKEVRFSEYFPEFGPVSFVPGSGNECAGDGEDIYGLPAGFLALGSHLSHQAGGPPVPFEI
ncbi:hypothetical protein BJY01DRAFT_39839 [Aspergillus pseudoustus]|uniref:Zn(2)-C6 fungal-type domain-containing protein n=1 Tax=Aspergillus pseudoustus TaxID=1810923 RepID=A0ABR4JCT6_9EURO